MKVGDRVRVQRDEQKYPVKGTWPMFRGRTARITAVLRGRHEIVVGRPPERPKTEPAWPREVWIDTEYGVSFSKTQSSEAYFRPHELVKL